MRALEIIDKAADHRPEEIADYLKQAISKEEIEFSEISPEEHLREVVDAFNETVLEMADFCGRDYQGIIGGVIYGSYGKRVPNYESDLDIVFVSKSDEGDLYVADQEKFVRYLPDFREKLQKKTGTAVDIWHGSYTLDDLERHIIGENQPAIFEGYEVASPYPEVKKQIEAKMAEIKKRQIESGQLTSD